ncbi:cyclin-T2 isoform X3 [Peromyscus maniculatus bairdii]|uniref:cyclin-T2 isoform X3 n=1 Tax=Peromyscus maniculatus bairdii TaxID=230844 RepID=UPI00042AB7B5|nr:cyclin-T2 isoform X3 [Peromyscus maniculatus bairdii]XP_015841976.1 cyclin-T2 isoform X3 [Peromyscus maniculatus bairdii]
MLLKIVSSIENDGALVIFVSTSKDLAQTSYFMATNSLHLTTFCLQYKPTVIACVCIHLACKWSNWEIPVSTDGKHWWEYVDPTVTLELLDELTHEFLQILEKTPSRLKRIRNWRAMAKKPKVDGPASETPLLGPSLVQNSLLVDSVTGGPANPSFQKPSTSTFPAPVPLSSGSTCVQDSRASDSLSVLATGMPSTSYSLSSSHQEWPQHPDSARTDPVYTQKQEATLSGSQYLSFQQGPSMTLHSGLHHRPDKVAEHPSAKQEYAHKSGSSKHHGPVPAAPGVAPQKMSLDKYREKRKLETLDLDTRDHYIAAHAEQQHKHGPAQAVAGSSVTSPIKMKLAIANSDKPERSMAEKKEKSGSLKLRLPIPPPDKGPSKEELKMKIKVSSSERHSSSDEGSGKSKHSSPHISRDHKEKHKEHLANRHHSSHKHLYMHGGGGGGGGGGSGVGSVKHAADGMPPTVLRSPVGLGPEGISSSSSARKKLHVNDASHNHHSKMSKSSKSSGSSSSSSSVKQYLSSHSSVFNHPLPPPPPVTYQVGYGHLSTLVKLDKKPVEPHGPEANHEYSTSSQHLDYKDTFDMLDSLLSAQGMNM